MNIKAPIVLVFILVLSTGLSAQDVKFEHISLEQGLSQSFVECILQDSRGFMWFGTQDGLNKYDGYTFTVYKHNPVDSTSLSDNWVQTIYEDKGGTLWVGTYSGGLNRFDREKNQFVHYKHHPDNSNSVSHNFVRSIYEDNFGTLWIGTAEGGLDKFDRESGKWTHYVHNPADSTSLSHNSAGVIYEDNLGNFWIGTDNGLNQFDRKKGIFTVYQHRPNDPTSLSHNVIKAIYEDKSGTLWIATDGGGLNQFNREKGIFIHYKHRTVDPNSLSSNYVESMCEDQSGRLWIATDGGGLDRFDREKEVFTHYKHDPANPNSLSNNRVISVYVDDADILWVGTYGGGINKKKKEKFIHYKTDPANANSLSHNSVWSIVLDSAGILWIGTDGGGLNKFDRKKGLFTHYTHDPTDSNSLSHNRVSAVYEDRNGTLWIGTFGGGLNRLDGEKFRRYRHDPANPRSLSDDRVLSIYEDKAGILWIGTYGGGLNRFNRETETFIHYKNDPTHPNSLSDNRVLPIYEDSAGMLWIGTLAGGLNQFDRKNGIFTHYKHDPADTNSISSNRIQSIYEDRSGRLWIATDGGGLNRFDRQTGKFIHYLEEDGLPNNVVYGILSEGSQPAGESVTFGEDDNENLWLSTNKGLSRFTPPNSLLERESGEMFKNYDVSDGLQSNEFNSGAYYKSKSGEMFFGGINGINVFHPDSLRSNPHIPPIVLTNFYKLGKRLNLGKAITEIREIELSYEENFFSFEFAALDYANPQRNQYAYKLEGLDRDWIYCGTRRYANYTDVDPGNYLFRVKGANSDGIWNEEGISIKIRITPPFWRTWWFYLLSFGAIIALALFGHRYKVNQSLKLERVRMLESEQIRKKAAADFHDELGHKLTQISLFVEVIKTRFSALTPEVLEYLNQIGDTSKSLSNAMRNFIWTLDPEQDSLYDLAIYLKDFGDELFDKTGIAFRIGGISEELKDVTLSMDWKRHLTLIFKEGMNNVLKHAECQNVMLKIGVNNGQLRMILSDDGRGFNIEECTLGNGLRNMKRRAKEIQGEIKITSNPERGTTILFTGEIT